MVVVKTQTVNVYLFRHIDLLFSATIIYVSFQNFAGENFPSAISALAGYRKGKVILWVKMGLLHIIFLELVLTYYFIEGK